MKKGKTFWAYLASYGILLTVPLLLLLLVVFQLFIRQYRDNIVLNYEAGIEKSVSFIDTSVGQIISDVIQISGMKAFYTKYLADNYSGMYDVAETLKRMNFSNDFLHNSFFYNRKTEQIYATDAVYSVDDFFIYGFGNIEVDKEPLLEVMNRTDSYTWFPEIVVNSTGERMAVVTYVAPVIRGSGVCDSVMICQIPTEYLSDLFGGTDSGETYYLLNKAGQIVWSKGTYIVEEDFLQDIGGADGKIHSQAAVINGKKVQLLSLYSPVARLQCVGVIPVETLMGPVYKIIWLLVYGVVAILGLGSLMIVFYMRSLYQPVYKLGQLARLVQPSSEESESEIEYAYQAMSHLFRSKENAMERNRELRHEKLLYRLLTGGFKTVEEFNQAQQNHDFILKGENFLILAVYVDQEDTEQEEDYSDEGLLLPEENDQFLIYPLELPQEQLRLFLISGPEGETEEWNRQITNLTEYFQGKAAKYCLGIGCRYGSVMDIGKSYLEAKTAAISAKTLSIPVRYYDQVDKRQYVFPQEMALSMHDALKFSDSVRIHFLCDSLILSMRQRGNVLYAACLLGWFLHMICPNSPDRFVFSDSIVVKYTKRLLEISPVTMEEITGIVTELSAELTKGFHSSEQEETNQILDMIVDYINNNYTNPDFCVKIVADKFDMSVSNLSHYFKKHSGETISGYINELKFGKAKELLRTTKLSVSEIAEQIGNMQTSSFLRKFKQMEGMTPSEYRRLHGRH